MSETATKRRMTTEHRVVAWQAGRRVTSEWLGDREAAEEIKREWERASVPNGVGLGRQPLFEDGSIRLEDREVTNDAD